MYTLAHLLVCFRIPLNFGSARVIFAYENAENQYPRRTVRPKRPPGVRTQIQKA